MKFLKKFMLIALGYCCQVLIRSLVPIILTSWGSFLALEYMCLDQNYLLNNHPFWKPGNIQKEKGNIISTYIFLIFLHDLLSYKGEVHFIFMWERIEKYQKCKWKYQFPKGNSFWDMFYNEFISFVPLLELNEELYVRC